jgi:aerobic-type carbon monoxide dehydrogenase small subunit (CoxS/CutS family)
MAAEIRTLTMIVNDETRQLTLPEDTPLLMVLRQDFELKGTRMGCGEGQCGACTVLVDGRPMQSCSTPLWSVATQKITTIEGLSDRGVMGRVQQAFLDEQAAQCGYCTNGIIMTLAGLMARAPLPTRHEVLEVLDERHLCRCGAHVRILRAIDRLIATPAETPA